jgi:methyl-accepting chemotaxis protein
MVFAYIANLRTMAKLIVSFSLVLLVGLTVNLISVRSSATQQQATGWTEHTYQVLRTIDDMISGMVIRRLVCGATSWPETSGFLSPKRREKPSFDQHSTAPKA